MLLRKTAWFWKSGLATISFVLILSISGCSDAPPEEDTVSETVIDVQAIPEESQENTEEIINICMEETKSAEEEAAEQWAKGYDLPVNEQEVKEAEKDCIIMMELIFDIYEGADKGSASNVVLSDEIVFEMQKKLAETKCSINTLITYSN